MLESLKIVQRKIKVIDERLDYLKSTNYCETHPYHNQVLFDISNHEKRLKKYRIIEKDLKAFEIFFNKLTITKSKDGDFNATIQDLTDDEISLLKKYRKKTNK